MHIQASPENEVFQFSSTSCINQPFQNSLSFQVNPCKDREIETDPLSVEGTVFVRHNATQSPFDHPDDGPFEVLERYDKFVKLSLNNRVDHVSIDRLKSAFLESVFEESITLLPFQCDHIFTQTSSVIIGCILANPFSSTKTGSSAF